MPPTLWEKVKTGGKTGFDKTWKAVDKLGAPVNKLSNKLGSEAFWPTTLDKESDKAARILQSFCKDGFYAEEETQPLDGPKQKQKVIKKIPSSVIKNAQGLAIFTTMRTGLWISGAGGSGVLIARKPDGSWSSPSGIMLHTAGLGFLVGVDIYDCVVVINTQEALQAFTKVRCTLGGEISATAGPVGAGFNAETEVHKRQSPIFTYMKSRGFYAGVQIDGTVVIERTDENERFYNERIGVTDILAGKARYAPSYDLVRLTQTVKAAQGDTDVNESFLPAEPPPGDYELQDGHVFGIPDKEDPDPYGVLALEKEGMGVVEAGTKQRASWEQFSFNPSPSSPVHNLFPRRSQDDDKSYSRRSSWRTSVMSGIVTRNGQLGGGGDPKTPSSLRNSMDIGGRPAYANSATQTDMEDGGPPSPSKRSYSSNVSRKSSRGSVASGGSARAAMQDVPENGVLAPVTSHEKPSPKSSPQQTNGYNTPPHTPPIIQEEQSSKHDDIRPSLDDIRPSLDVHDDDLDDQNDGDGDGDDEAVVHDVQTVQAMRPVAAQRIQKATIVSVPKRGPPPKLPPRNPSRRTAHAESPASSEDAPAPPRQDSTSKSSPSLGGSEKYDDDPLERKLDEVKLVDNDNDNDSDSDEDDEDRAARMRDPWAKVEQARAKRASLESNGSGSRMPGGFE